MTVPGVPTGIVNGAEPFEPETGEVLDEDDEGELNARRPDGKIVAFTCRTATQNGINPTCWVTVGLITFTAPCQDRLGLGRKEAADIFGVSTSSFDKLVP